MNQEATHALGRAAAGLAHAVRALQAELLVALGGLAQDLAGVADLAEHAAATAAEQLELDDVDPVILRFELPRTAAPPAA